VTPPKLVVDKLMKSYRGQTPVLDGASLELHAGEVLGLVGASGAGKSTLARCIAGIEQADSGDVRLDGERLGATRTRPQKQRIQYIWQEAHMALSPLRSALQAVVEPLEGFSLAPAQDRAAQAAHWLGRMGLGSATMQRRPDGLSGGQCQRAVIARALAAEPEVLLLDEPFSALDTVTTVALMRLLQSVLSTRPMAVLFVSHDRQAVRRLASRALCLAAGRLSQTELAAPGLLHFARKLAR
jgi:ABC-type dipeptide/oligopeptide/nickel transport system ATPase subunit